jgi:hypothetical protein
MKGIGIFVALLLVAFGVAVYFFTRPPDRTLDAAGKAWVARFTTWRDETARRTDRAYVAIGSAPDRKSVRLVDGIGACSGPLARLGDPPGFLHVVTKDAGSACAEIEYAASLNTSYGASALATTRQHLHGAEQWLAQAKLDLSEQLAPSGS